MKLILLIICVISISSCNITEVKPWDRGVLARNDMQFDPSPLTTAIDDHAYFSKEASSGGRSFAGGGCGCN